MDQGNVALITGASGGIGEELAKVFAAHGFNVVLVARTEAKLRELGSALEHKHGIKAYAIAADLSDSKSPAEVMGKVAELGLSVDVLVNNAGFADYGQFAKSDLGKQMQMIQVNMATLTELSYRVLQGMLERGRGRILNVASTAAFMPGPLMSVYYATKAYVLSFSEALNEELKGTGVNVTTLAPGPVATGFQSRAEMEGSKLLQQRLNPPISAEAVAKTAYDALMNGKAVIIPGFMNQMQALFPRLLPRALVPGIVKNAQARSR